MPVEQGRGKGETPSGQLAIRDKQTYLLMRWGAQVEGGTWGGVWQGRSGRENRRRGEVKPEEKTRGGKRLTKILVSSSEFLEEMAGRKCVHFLVERKVGAASSREKQLLHSHRPLHFRRGLEVKNKKKQEAVI